MHYIYNEKIKSNQNQIFYHLKLFRTADTATHINYIGSHAAEQAPIYILTRRLQGDVFYLG
jgi:hypothetical protein